MEMKEIGPAGYACLASPRSAALEKKNYSLTLNTLFNILDVFGRGKNLVVILFCNLKVFISIKVNLLGQKHNHSSSFADSLCNINYYWNSRHKVSHVKNHLESMIFLQNWCRSIIFH